MYQFTVPAVAVATKTKEPVPQREAAVVDAIVGVIVTVIAPVIVLVNTIPLVLATFT